MVGMLDMLTLPGGGVSIPKQRKKELNPFTGEPIDSPAEADPFAGPVSQPYPTPIPGPPPMAGGAPLPGMATGLPPIPGLLTGAPMPAPTPPAPAPQQQTAVVPMPRPRPPEADGPTPPAGEGEPAPIVGAEQWRENAPSGSLLSRVGDMINRNPLTLMSLGAGLAGAQSWGQGISRGLAAAVPAMNADQKLMQQQQGISQTYRAMVERGIPPQDALAAVYNPEVMKAVVTKYFEGKPPTWGVTGHDRFNNPVYGFIDPYKQTAIPANTPHVASVEDALRLPKGTQFVDPDGVLRVR